MIVILTLDTDLSKTCKGKDTSIQWSDRNGLVLYTPIVPATASTPSCQWMVGHLEGLLAEPKEVSSPVYQASRPSTSSSMDDIQTPMSSSGFSSDFLVSKPNPVTQASPVPRVKDLPPPDRLLSQSKFHVMCLRIERNRQHVVQTPANSSLQHLSDRIIIQSTHEPSLQLIHDYFTKWTRPDVQTREKVPLMRHTLCPSAVGPNYHDTLVVEPFSQVSARSGSMLNPALYQCFIEGTLGYEIVYRSTSEGHNGASWEFCRSRPFA